MTVEHVHACVSQELFEVLAKVVVGDLPRLAAEFVLHRRAVVHVVRWIAEDHVGQTAGEDLLHVGHLRGIAAQQPVLPENPDIAGNRDCGLRSLRHSVIVGIAGVNFIGVPKQSFDLVIGKPDQLEIETVLIERGHFNAEHLLIPPGVECQSVVGQH